MTDNHCYVAGNTVVHDAVHRRTISATPENLELLHRVRRNGELLMALYMLHSVCRTKSLDDALAWVRGEVARIEDALAPYPPCGYDEG